MSVILACPIGKEKVDSRVSRANAVWTFVLSGLSFVALYRYMHSFVCVLSPNAPLIPPLVMLGFLALDFLARFTCLKLSVISLVNRSILHGILRLRQVPIDAKPKKFAAKLGFTMTLIAFSLVLFAFKSGSDVVIPYAQAVLLLLVFASAMEAFLDFCVGCFVYSLLWQKKIKKGARSR